MPHTPRDHSVRRQGEEPGADASARRRQTARWIAVGVAFLVVLVVLHLTGVVGSQTNG